MDDKENNKIQKVKNNNKKKDNEDIKYKKIDNYKQYIYGYFNNPEPYMIPHNY